MKKLILVSVLSAISPTVMADIDLSEHKEHRHVGYIQSKTTSNISIKTSGIIEKWNIDVGDIVKEGDILVSLEETNQSTELNKIRSQVAVSQKTMESNEKLRKRQYQTEIEYLSSVYDYKSALNDLRVAEKSYNDLELKAPFSGIIQSKNIEIGEYVSQGTSVATIADNQNFEVYSDIYKGNEKCSSVESCSLYFENKGELVGPLEIDYIVPLQENGMFRIGSFISGDYNYGLSKDVYIIPNNEVKGKG